MSRRKAKAQWVPPNEYIKFLHDHAAIALDLYYTFFAAHKETDYETFWHKNGFISPN